MQNPALALLLKLPVALVAHICTLLGVYPTNDVGSMLVLSRSTHAEWKSCDLLFLALKNQLNSRPKFQGVHDTTFTTTTTTIKPSPSRHRTLRSPRRSSKRLKVSGTDLLQTAIQRLRVSAESAHDDLFVLGASGGLLRLAGFTKVLRKWCPLDANHLHQERSSTLLMEVTKLSIRRTTPQQVAAMVRELLSKWNVDPSRGHPTTNLSPLMIAAARGYVRAVKILLEFGACSQMTGRGVFFSSVGTALGHSRLRYVGEHDALGWSKAMHDLEKSSGATEQQLSDLGLVQKELNMFIISKTKSNIQNM